MLISRLLLFSLIFVLTLESSFAQNIEEANKEKQRQRTVLLEQVLADVPNLKLPENRAFIYARTGNLMWQTDAKRARELFQNAVSELINAQTIAENDKKTNQNNYDLLNSQGLRPNILNMIAAQNAEFALESLYKTRPAKIIKAMSAYQQNGAKINKSNNPSDAQIIQAEINLEQNLLARAAEQSPERAAELLEKSIEKGITPETISLLKKLHAKSPAKAQQMLGDITAKLLKFNYAADNRYDSSNLQNFSVALTFLNEFIREKSEGENALNYDSSQLQSLGEIIISTVLKSDSPNYRYSISQLISIAQKLFPNRVESLKQKQNALAKYQYGDISSVFDKETLQLMQNDASPEILISTAKKLSFFAGNQLYQRAANKYAEQGNFDLAEKTLSENLSDEELENAVNNLSMQRAYKEINSGNFNEALNLINQLPENLRINLLVSAANSVYEKDPQNNKSFAGSILEQAYSLINSKPENSNEMSYLTQIIAAYTKIEPAQAFRLLEPLVFQINELSEAAVLVSGFTGNGQIWQGEITLYNSNPFGIYLGEVDTPLRNLLKIDFDRTLQIIEHFQRRETRISLKLLLAESIN